MVAVPLKYGPRVIGVVVISKLGVGQFDEDDVRLLEVLGGHASVALENARLYEAERNEAERAKESLEIANALLDFSRELAAAEGLDDVLARIVELTARTLGLDRTVRLAAGAPSRGSDGAASVRLRRARRARRSWRLRIPHDVAKRCLSGRRAVRARRRRGVATHRRARRQEGISTYAWLPCTSTPTGSAASPRSGRRLRRALRPRAMRLLSGIAHQAKLAIQNARASSSLEETFLSTVEALANALEANDEYTSSHARWITDMALKVGRELGLDAKTLKRLELGALFHDIGKIGIPSTILSKPGPLTPRSAR